MASLLAEGFSYAATGKGVADHGISMVAEKDCAVFRAVKGEEICRENAGHATATAFAPSDGEEDRAEGVIADAEALTADGLPPYGGPTGAMATAGAGAVGEAPAAAAHLAARDERPI